MMMKMMMIEIVSLGVTVESVTTNGKCQRRQLRERISRGKLN